jgi:hypothetical protein
MSSEAISFYLEETKGTGSLGFYYDFKNWSGNYLLNTGSPEYPTYSGLSGKLIGDLNQFTGQASGSGSFHESYIEIENTEILSEVLFPTDQSKEFTYLFSQRKVDNSCGTIFSNYSTDYEIPSGWEIGINNCNQLYFMYQGYNNDGQRTTDIKTLNNIPAAQNWYGVSLSQSYVSIGRYVPYLRSWENQRFSVKSQYINNSNTWRIGSGEYIYSGYMDKFIYINQGLSFSEMRGVVESSYQSLATEGEETKIIDGGITGYSYFPTGETGIIATTGIYSGTVTYTGTGEYTIGSPDYGNVSSGENYYVEYSTFSGQSNPVNPFTGASYLSKWALEDMTNVITGLNYFQTGYSSEWTVDIYESSGISGVIWTGSGSSPLYEPSQEIVLLDGVTGLSGSMHESQDLYAKDTISYLGERGDERDFCELIYNIDGQNLNKSSRRSFSPNVGREVFYIGLEYLPTEASALNLYQNGVFQATGIEEAGNINPAEPSIRNYNIKSGNFILREEAIDEISGIYSSEDSVFYDVAQSGASGRLYITGEDPYSAAPYSDIPMENSEIFFNGQKIYSGINWDDSGGEFNPIGGITSIIPDSNQYFIYEARPEVSGENKSYITGERIYDFTNIGGFNGMSGDNFLFYLNGIRDQEVLVYSTGVSLLSTGVDIMINSMENLTNRYYYISNGEVINSNG